MRNAYSFSFFLDVVPAAADIVNSKRPARALLRNLIGGDRFETRRSCKDNDRSGSLRAHLCSELSSRKEILLCF